MATPRRSLIFDLDGTLIDSAPDLAAALNALLAELGRPPLSFDQVRRLIGDGAPTLVARALLAAGAAFEPETYESLLERYRALYLAHAMAETRVYPHVPETLRRLREDGYRTVVCTNKFQRPSLMILEALDLARYFDGVAGGDVVPARKPDPAHLLATLRGAGGEPAHAVMAGDHANDVAAARGAGLPCVFAAWGYGPAAMAEGAAAMAGDFDQLVTIVRRLVP